MDYKMNSCFPQVLSFPFMNWLYVPLMVDRSKAVINSRQEFSNNVGIKHVFSTKMLRERCNVSSSMKVRKVKKRRQARRPLSSSAYDYRWKEVKTQGMTGLLLFMCSIIGRILLKLKGYKKKKNLESQRKCSSCF